MTNYWLMRKYATYPKRVEFVSSSNVGIFTKLKSKSLSFYIDIVKWWLDGKSSNAKVFTFLFPLNFPWRVQGRVRYVALKICCVDCLVSMVKGCDACGYLFSGANHDSHTDARFEIVTRLQLLSRPFVIIIVIGNPGGVGTGIFGVNLTMPWLLMPWLLVSPGHQKPWYWLYRIIGLRHLNH